jgi:hypothetical protein
VKQEEGKYHRNVLKSLTVDMLKEGVKVLLRSLEDQMMQDREVEMQPCLPRAVGITILQTLVDAPDLKSGIWSLKESVERLFLEGKIVRLMPARLPTSHSGWQFFMSGAGDVTNPHIDPPLTRTIFWQVIGYKIWCIWPATPENLDAFELVGEKRTWKWALDNLSESGRKFFIMEPGTWWELKQSEIHACISLTPSAHAVQEFFNVDDAEEILRVWKYTEKYRQQDTPITTEHPQPFRDWLPTIFDIPAEELEPIVKSAKELYSYGLGMVTEGKSDQITSVAEVCVMLPLVRQWIERHALSHNR